MDRPNLILILIDDLGWMDLRCYGSSFYETPHLDRMAEAGLRFTDAYASSPVCSPTRASVLTGRYPARVGVTQYIGGHTVGRLCDVPYFSHLPLSEVSLATELRQAGYATWHVGKWHLGGGTSSPERHGFEVNIAGSGWGRPHEGYFSPWGMQKLAEGPEGEYLTDRLTNEAIRLIRSRDRNRPYFLNLWHYAVHTPIEAPEDLLEKYRAKAAALGLDRKDPFEEGERFPVLHKKDLRVRRRLFQSDPAYAAMVENLDHNIGRVLDELGDDALIIFSSDNGGLSTAEGSPTSNAPLSEGKGWMYEGGTRVDQIALGPGVRSPGTTCTIPVTSTDFYPTFLEAAGLPLRPQQHCDGESLVPLLDGKTALEERPLFWHYPHYSNQGGTPAAAVRRGDWKLIEFFEDGHLELYNLRDDLAEEANLALSEKNRVRELHDALKVWRREIEALIPKRNPNYEAQFEAGDPPEV